MNTMRDMSKSDILNALGLQTRRSPASYVAGAIGILAAGILVGVGIGMLAAPKSGRQLREDIGKQVSRMGNRGRGVGVEQEEAH